MFWIQSSGKQKSISLTFSSFILNRHYIYEVQTRNNFPLSSKVDERQVPKLQHVLWAPKVETGSNNPSQAIAFVYANDLYYKPNVQNDLVCRITTTGKAGTIYNGIPDWFYANIADLKSDTVAFSTDGSFLSYLSFNDTEVQEYRLVCKLQPFFHEIRVCSFFVHPSKFK